MRARIALAAGAAVLAATLLVAGLAAASSASSTKLFGVVGPGFTITLKNASGKRVTSVKAGSHTFVITDKASIHDFNLAKSGNGSYYKQLTGVTFKGVKTVTIKLTKGPWLFYCTQHPDDMNGRFNVK